MAADSMPTSYRDDALRKRVFVGRSSCVHPSGVVLDTGVIVERRCGVDCLRRIDDPRVVLASVEMHGIGRRYIHDRRIHRCGIHGRRVHHRCVVDV
jgi:hypothetical protein